MEAQPAVSTPPAENSAHSKFHTFVQIAMTLSVITGIEIVLVYLPFAKWLIVSALVILSAVKFLFVIFFFMHLRWDKLFCQREHRARTQRSRSVRGSLNLLSLVFSVPSVSELRALCG